MSKEFKISQGNGPTRCLTFTHLPSWEVLAARLSVVYHIPVAQVALCYQLAVWEDSIVLNSDRELDAYYEKYHQANKMMNFKVLCMDGSAQDTLGFEARFDSALLLATSVDARSSQDGRWSDDGGTQRVLSQINGEWAEFGLEDKWVVNNGTAVYCRFRLPNQIATLGAPCGQGITLAMDLLKGSRLRTSSVDVHPISNDDDYGFFDVILETKGVLHEQISRHLVGLNPGDTIRMRGPIGHYVYTPNKFRRLNMIAEGTGIAPMLPFLHCILKNEADNTKVALIYINENEQAVFRDHRLRKYLISHGHKFRLTHVLRSPSKGWSGPSWPSFTHHVSDMFVRPQRGVSQLLICVPTAKELEILAHILTLGYSAPNLVGEAGDEVYMFPHV